MVLGSRRKHSSNKENGAIRMGKREEIRRVLTSVKGYGDQAR